MSVFAASDIVEVAIRIEENGVNFYKFAEQIAKKEDEKKLFAELAQAEVAHKKTFEKLFASMEKSNLPESYEGEFGAYLRSYVDNNLIFTKEIMDKQLAKITDTNSALDFAIQRELDSILYYHEIKKIVPAAQHDAHREDHRRRKKTFSVSDSNEKIFSLLII